MATLAIFLFFTALVPLTISLLVYGRCKDIFHPIIYLSMISVFLYVIMPAFLLFDKKFSPEAYFSMTEWNLVFLVNLLGVCAMLLGCVVGSRHYLAAAKSVDQECYYVLQSLERLYRVGIALGVIGVASFLFRVLHAGGFVAVFGSSYGFAAAASGYLGDAELLTKIGIIFVFLGKGDRRLNRMEWLIILVFSFPDLTQGFLGARRGPTFMLVVILGMAFYMSRGKRPATLPSLVAAVGLGVLLVMLVSLRDEIYLGSEMNFAGKYFDALNYSDTGDIIGNEFLAGATNIVYAERTGILGFGRIWLITLFVRPIPQQIWPDKFADAANFLGLQQRGTYDWISRYLSELGVAPNFGSAPGVVGDAWDQFGWGALAVLFFLGWLHGKSWGLGVTRRGLFVVIFIILSGLSVFFAQILSQWLYRVAFMLGISCVCWFICMRRTVSKLERTRSSPYEGRYRKTKVEWGARRVGYFDGKR